MHSVNGACHCGNIVVELQLANEPGSYHPRACDCAFCRKHGAAYLSDPQGSLRLRIKDQRQGGTYRQGSGLAEMLLCTQCGVLIGALYRSEERIYATVNVRVIEGVESFGTEQPVSPRKLSGDQKISRWTDLWFSSVALE
jgi:hypothetical protein